MPVPTLNESQIAWVFEQVATYIERQGQRFRHTAVPLSENQLVTFRPFFPATTLEAATVVVLTSERVGNPSFHGQLVQLGFEPAALPSFSLMAAITFVDTVLSHEPFTDRLLFHELVHVVRFEKLGLEGFARKYVRGLPEWWLLRQNSAGDECLRTGHPVCENAEE
jgi:hypothetical protein